jgi:hypothetical protein
MTFALSKDKQWLSHRLDAAKSLKRKRLPGDIVESITFENLKRVDILAFNCG